MTAPITKTQGDQIWLDDSTEWTRIHAPKVYAQQLRRRQQAQEAERFFTSTAGQTLMSEVEAFFAQPQQQEKYAEFDRKHQAKRQGRNRAAYELLGVQPGATQTQIKKAYRQKARELHPDKGGNEAAMKRLNTAYQKLTTTKQ